MTIKYKCVIIYTVSTKDTTCTEPGEERSDCSRCNYFETRSVDANGHDYKAVVTAPDCKKGGYTTYTCGTCGDTVVDSETEALGHIGGTATCQNKAICTRCGSSSYGKARLFL